MIAVDVPGRRHWAIEHLVLDVNGTLAVDGTLMEGVAVRLQHLREQVQVHLLTADTHGRQAEIDAELGLRALRLQPGSEAEQKAEQVRRLGADGVVAIGNGANDESMLRAAAIGILVIAAEGAAAASLLACDIVTRNATDALDLLLNPRRLVATLRR